MRQSLITSALCLTLVQTVVDARAHNKFPQLKIRDGEAVVERAEEGGLLGWAQSLSRALFRRQDASSDDSTCYQDAYYNFIQDLSNSQSFCQAYMDYPNQTVTVDYTPTSTTTFVYSTHTITETSVTRTTPVRTVTVTSFPPQKAKREAEAQITARAEYGQAQIAEVFNMFRRQNADSSSAGSGNDTASLSSAMSSACSCQNYGGSTVTATYTNDPTVSTLSAFGEATVTTTTTRGGRATTVTTTVIAPPPSPPPASSGTGSIVPLSSVPAAPASSANVTSAAATSTSPTSAPTPTSPAFICPDDDGDVITQMVGSERFDYMVNCSTDLTSSNFYGALAYSTFGQCVSACSYADANFSSPIPVCQGVSYYNSPNVDGYNCFLKTSGNGSVPMPGVDSAVLLRMVMGVDAADPDGTTTEAAPFGGATTTYDPAAMSSSMSEVMANSTSTMPMITPGPPMPQSGLLVNAGGYTSFSTYVSNGSTFSTGTVYSTYYSSDGVWYYSYYTSYSLQWASATTEYAVGAQETQIAGTNNTSTSEQSGSGGGYNVISVSNSTSYYPGGYNVTEVTTNQTYASNNTELSSTAVTSFYSYQTGGGGSGSGGSGNGSITSTANVVTSTSLFSTQTIIVNSGATGGASGYAGSGSIGAPSTSATTIFNSGGSAYSSGYLASGAVTGTGGASGNAGSGSITSAPESTITVITVTNGTAYSSEFVGSGSLVTTSYNTSFAMGGVPVPSTSVTTIINSGGSAYSSGFLASGSIGGTGGASGYAGSGSIVSLPATTSTTIILNTAGSAFSSGYLASGSIGGTGGMSGTAASGSMPVSTPNAPRTGSQAVSTPNAPRTGSQATITPTPPGSLPVPYSFPGTAPGSSSPYPTDQSNRTGSQGPPLSTGPSPYPSPSGSLTAPGGNESSTLVSASSFVTPYLPPYSLPGTAPSVPSSSPVSTPLDSRTGLQLPSTSLGTAPASSGSPMPSANSTTALTPTSPPIYSFPAYSYIPLSGSSPVSTPLDSRTGLQFPSTSLGTAPASSGSPIPSANSTTGVTPTAPPSYPFPPIVTGSSPVSTPLDSRTGLQLPSTTSMLPSGSGSPVPSLNSTIMVPTAPSSYTFPTTTAPATCANGTMGTTTIFSTTTVYGCWDSCATGYGYGSPHPFGPGGPEGSGGPAWATDANPFAKSSATSAPTAM